MPNTDLFDRAEGYGHTDGVQASKDDGNWTVLPTVPASEEESTSDRLFRSVDDKHAATPTEFDAGYDNNFIPASDDRFRRYITFDMDENGDDVVRDADGRAVKTYVGDNENRVDVQSTEAAVYNRPVNGWDNDDYGEGTGIDLANEHVGYRKHDETFPVELTDPNDSTEDSAAKPAVSTLAPTLAGGQPADEYSTVDDLDGNFDPA